ncbi:MAG: hypothetical protein M3Y72_08635 [Acidobacteriota bacterium]|nr:hypothetical protein [Acidobacteriota bacterium]
MAFPVADLAGRFYRYEGRIVLVHNVVEEGLESRPFALVASDLKNEW